MSDELPTAQRLVRRRTVRAMSRVALLTSGSLHGSKGAIPLGDPEQERMTCPYELMDAPRPGTGP